MTTAPDEPLQGDGKDRNFITALARGLDILRAFRPGETALSNTDLAERTGLPKATVSRLTFTLRQLEYLVGDPQGGGYRLGPGVLQLGYGVLAGMDIAARGKGILEDLAANANRFLSYALAERHQFQAIYMVARPSAEDISLHLTVGARLPLFESSIGRAILAGMDDAACAAILEQVEEADPDQASQRRDWVAKARDEYARNGFVTGYGDWRADVNAIAAPVWSLDGNRIWGLNAGGPSFHVSSEELEEIHAPRLLAAARALDPASRNKP